MKEYREGLNFIPILAQNLSPPTSSRSLLSIGKKRSQRSFLSYNGNYEGDISMFKDNCYELERLHLEDSDSDLNDLLKDEATISTNVQISLMWSLLHYIIVRYCQPDKQEKIFERLQQIMNSFWYKNMLKCVNSLCYLCAIILKFALKLFYYLAFFCYLMWKRRLIFRNMLRSILWWLTLAKCSDLALFALILICSPVQFVLALIGFIIALGGFLRNLLQNWSYAIKYQLI